MAMIEIVLPLLAASIIGSPAVLDGGAVSRLPQKQISTPPARNNSCTEAIRLVRQAVGLPRLDTPVGSTDGPLFLAAVDHRIGNCRVLMMAKNHGDIRPEPQYSPSNPRLRPAR
jgi:hypothetical protein